MEYEILMGCLFIALPKLTGIRVFVKCLSNRLWDTNPHLSLLSEEQSNESDGKREGTENREIDSV